MGTTMGSQILGNAREREIARRCLRRDQRCNDENRGTLLHLGSIKTGSKLRSYHASCRGGERRRQVAYVVRRGSRAAPDQGEKVRGGAIRSTPSDGCGEP